MIDEGQTSNWDRIGFIPAATARAATGTFAIVLREGISMVRRELKVEDSLHDEDKEYVFSNE